MTLPILDGEIICSDSPACAADGCADCERSYGPQRADCQMCDGAGEVAIDVDDSMPCPRCGGE